MARVIPPLPITAARLTSSTAPEPGVGETPYSAGTTYGLDARAILGAPTSTVTISIASPGVVSWASHGQPEGTPLVLTTTGALPTGLTAGIVYYVRNPEAGTLQLALTRGGVPIVTTGSQSGTHTATTQIHRKYKSLQAGNTGHYPASAASAEWWKDDGPTNRHAMFDYTRNTKTELATGPLTVVVTPGQRVDSVAVLAAEATSAQLSVDVGGTVYDTGVVDLNDRDVVDWYDFWFAEFKTKPSLVRFDLPPFTGAVLTLTLNNTAGPVKCGAFVIGPQVYIGRVKKDAVSDVLNFSTVTRDDQGNATFNPVRAVPKKVERLEVESVYLDQIRALRTALDAVPAVYAGFSEDGDTGPYAETLLALGYYRRFVITMPHADESTIDLEVEEV